MRWYPEIYWPNKHFIVCVSIRIFMFLQSAGFQIPSQLHKIPAGVGSLDSRQVLLADTSTLTYELYDARVL